MFRSRSRFSTPFRAVAAFCLWMFLLTGVQAAPVDWKSVVEADWVSPAAVAKLTDSAQQPVVTTESDAVGGCDGIKDGQYGFHTDAQENPWWQVDLGQSFDLSQVVIYNRVAWPDRTANLIILISPDGNDWTEAYRHDGTPFCGKSDSKPLSVSFGGKSARFIRLQLLDTQYLHLDEVEVYGKDDPSKNLALNRPANQISVSPWSVGKIVTTNYPINETIERGRRLAQDLRDKGVDVESALRELDAVEAASRNVKTDSEGGKSLYLRTREIVRRLVMSNPLLDFDKILFVKRVPGTYSHMSDQNYGWWSRPGGGLYILEGFKSGSPKLKCLTESLPPGSVNSPSLSYDGKRVLFAYCKYYPELAKMNKYDKSKLAEDGFYHVYEMNVDGTGLRRLTKGKYDDFCPRYLPNGEIVFLSTRRGQHLQYSQTAALETLKIDQPDSYVRCGGDAWRPVAIYTLHTMSKDGGNLKPISAFESFEWTPAVDEDGRIIYARWDYVDRNDNPYMKLWSTNPDGTNARIVWGNYTSNPHCTFDAMRIPGTGKYVAIASPHHSITGGSLITIDPGRGSDGLDAITRLTPEVCFPEAEGWPSTFYACPHPLSENYFLVSWSNAPLMREGSSNAPNGMGLYVCDSFGNLELIYRDPEISSMYPIPLRPRKPETQRVNTVDWKGQQEGSFALCDVYQGLTGIERGTVKKLRVVAMPVKTQPWRDNPRIGFTTEDPGKCVLGTVPVAADGSAHFKVPSGVAVFFQALDSEGKSVQTMRSLTYVQPGQKLSCIGCHERRETSPPAMASVPVAVRNAPSKITRGPEGSWSLSYDKLVQPVLEKNCTSCHGPRGNKRPAGNIDLTNADKSYETLLNYGNPSLKQMVMAAFNRGSSIPGEEGAKNSQLLAMLQSKKGHHGVKLDADSLERLIIWMDMYAQRAGYFCPEQEKSLEALKDQWAALFMK